MLISQEPDIRRETNTMLLVQRNNGSFCMAVQDMP